MLAAVCVRVFTMIVGGVKLKIIEKLFCCHDWEILEKTEFGVKISLLLKCKKCGKLAKKRLGVW